MKSLHLLQGLEIVEKAAKNYIKTWRISGYVDWEDVLQEAHAQLAETIGEGYLAQLEESAAADGVAFEDSTLFRTLVCCMWKAERAIKGGKQHSWERDHQSIRSDLEIQKPPSKLLENSIDVAEAMDGLTLEEQEVWHLLTQGYKPTEVARKMGTSHQHVSRVKKKVIAKMTDILFHIKE